MSERRRKEEQKAAAAQQPKESSRRTTSFVNGNGIDREVITTDIYRYLGNDALVKPGTYQDTEGYFITAYRPLTSEQLRDIKNDSAKWQEEKRRNRGPTGGYDNSDTRQKVWGETEARQPAQPAYPNQQNPYGPPISAPIQSMGRGYESFQSPNQPPQPSAYRPPQPSTYNPGQDPQYITYSPPPMAQVNYNTMDRGRMDEPRSNPTYAGPISGQTIPQSYAAAPGRGAPQYYSGALPPSGPPPASYQVPSQEYQYGRAQQYDEYQDEDMEYEATATSSSAAPAPAAQPRSNDTDRKRPHEDRHRRRQ